jgi:hypothetical protein
MNVEIGIQNIILKFCFENNGAAQFHFWKPDIYNGLTGPSFAMWGCMKGII